MKVRELLAQVEKDYGEGVARIGATVDDCARLATGVFPFDLATGGGFPRGRTSILYGPESSLKTTLGLKAIARAQRLYPDQVGVVIDVENAFEPTWGRTLGVDTDKLIHVLPDTAEQTVDLVNQFIMAEDVSVILVDSIAAMIPQAEEKKSAEEHSPGAAGLAINKLYRSTNLSLKRARRENRYPTLILINQVRHKIGVMYGSPEVMPGGLAFKYASHLTVRLYGKDIEDKKLSAALPCAKNVTGVIHKHKIPIVAKAFEFNMNLLEREGLAIGEINDDNTVLAYLKELGLISKQGSKWVLCDPVTGEITSEHSTLRELLAALKGDPEFEVRIRETIIARMVEEARKAS